MVRAFNPAPGAWLEIGGERVKILSATRGAGLASTGVTLDDRPADRHRGWRAAAPIVQRAGKPAMDQ
jgi:methionyl-tRNA formyltransferase